MNIHEEEKNTIENKKINEILSSLNLHEQVFIPELLPTNLSLGLIHTPENEFIQLNQTPHLFSFIYSNKNTNFYKNKKLYPIPTFINPKNFLVKPDLSKNSILYGLSISDKNGLVLEDPEIIKKFKGLLTEIISQIFKAIFGTPISLPIKIFEPKSFLSRISEYWSFAPEFLSKASENSDPLQRMKLVITFSIAGLYIPTKQLKPFNPLLGETYQGEFEDGSKIYAEHISHHPLISRFYLKGKDDLYSLNTYLDFNTNTEGFGSKLKLFQKGPIHVNFKKFNSEIIYNLPVVKILNVNKENNRSSIWSGEMIFIDKKNGLKAVVIFGKNYNYIHGFEGIIYEVKFHKDYKFDLDLEKKQNLNKLKVLSKINGSWLKEIKFDQEELWNINKFVPFFISPSLCVLPSDSRYREDLIWLYRSWNSNNEESRKLYEGYAQNWKTLKEYAQRSDRDERKKNKK